MVPAPVLFAESAIDTAHAELREHNLFALRSTITSTTPLPSQGEAMYSAEGDVSRATGSLLREPPWIYKGVLA